DPLKLYSALGVPAAVVADLDFLDKDGEMRNVLSALGVEGESVSALCLRARQAMQQAKSVLSQEDTHAVLDELSAIVAASATGDHSTRAPALRGKLKRLSDR